MNINRDTLQHVGIGIVIGITLVFAIAMIADAAPLTIDDQGKCASWSISGNTVTCRSAPVVIPPDPPPDPPPTGGWTGTCQGFSKTVNLTWNWSQIQDHFDVAITPDGIAVIEFVPSPPLDSNNLAQISLTGYPAPNLGNYLTLAISNVPCSLRPPEPGYSISTSPAVKYGVGTVGVYWATGQPVGVAVQPGTRYYIMAANRGPNNEQTCTALPSGWNCHVRISIQKPQGH